MKKAVKIKSGVVAAVFIIIIVFWGSIEIRQLTDKEEHTEAGDMIEIEGINPQTAYAGESESQENMELNGKDANMDDDIDSIEKINKYIIPEQSFDVTLDGWGEITFVSCRPPSWQYEDTSFFLVRDEQILYKFPNSTKDDVELFDSVGAVAFRDINDDGKNDIIIIINYITEAGPQGMIPRPAARIFLAGENEFYLAEDMVTDVEKHMVDDDLTIEKICNFLQDKKEGPMAAGRLQERFPITFASLSYHLLVLKHSGLVTAKKEGQYRLLYDLNREALEGMVLWLSGLVEC